MNLIASDNASNNRFSSLYIQMVPETTTLSIAIDRVHDLLNPYFPEGWNQSVHELVHVITRAVEIRFVNHRAKVWQIHFQRNAYDKLSFLEKFFIWVRGVRIPQQLELKTWEEFLRDHINHLVMFRVAINTPDEYIEQSDDLLNKSLELINELEKLLLQSAGTKLT